MAKNNRIDMSLAPGWEDVTIYSMLGPELRGHRDLMTIAVDPSANSPLTDYAQERLPHQMAAIPEAEVIDEGEISLADGRRAYEVTVRSSGGRTIFYFITYFQEAGKSYTVTVQAAKHTMKATRAAMRTMLASLQSA